MPCVNRFQRDIFGVALALERLPALLHEDVVVLPPHRQDGDLAFLKVRMERRVSIHVGAVVVEQVELDVEIAGALHQGPVEQVARRVDRRVGARLAEDVLALALGECERGVLDRASEVRVLLAPRRGFPVRLQGGPEVLAQPGLVRVAVLRHDCGPQPRPLERDAQRRRRAVVEDVHCGLADLHLVHEFEDRVRDVLERVLEPGGDLGEAEAGEVGGDDVVFVGELGDEVAVLV